MKNHLLKSNIAKAYCTTTRRLKRYLIKIGITHNDKYLTPAEYERLKNEIGDPKSC